MNDAQYPLFMPLSLLLAIDDTDRACYDAFAELYPPTDSACSRSLLRRPSLPLLLFYTSSLISVIQAKAPEKHKASLAKEAARLAATSSLYTDIDSYFAYPMTLDWIVDLYFEDSDDATAYPVILDSGSSNLAIAISSCTNCEEASTTLDPTLVSDPEM